MKRHHEEVAQFIVTISNPSLFLIWMSDDHRIYAISDSVVNLCGKLQKDLIGKNFHKIFLGSSIGNLMTEEVINKTVLKKPTPLYTQHQQGNKILQISWSIDPYFDFNNQQDGYLLSGISVSKEQLEQPLSNEEDEDDILRYMRDAALKVTGDSDNNSASIKECVNAIRKHFENIIAQLPGSVYWKSKSGVYLGGNDNAAQLIGLSSRHDLQGRTDEDFARELEWDPGVVESFRRDNKAVLHGKRIINREEPPFRNASGNLVYQLTNRVPLLNKRGNIVGILGSSIDITDLVKTRHALEKAKKTAEAASKAKTNFIANMSHDLRTPFTGMYYIIDALLETAKALKAEAPAPLEGASALKQLVDRLETDMTVMQACNNALLDFHNQVLEVINLESGVVNEQPISFCLLDPIETAIALHRPSANEKHLELSYGISESVPEQVSGLYHYFHKTLLNLLSNAVKFTEHGFIKIRVDLQHATNSGSRPFKPGDTASLQITVEDSGIGIPKDKYHEIFENLSRLTPSYEGKYQGSGMGLYAVKNYVKAMGGTIDVHSAVGKGSTFIVMLPFTVSVPEEATAPSVSSEGGTPFSPESPLSTTLVPSTSEAVPLEHSVAAVLLVEDSSIVAMATQNVLQTLQCQVDIVETGADAVQKASEGECDLILMDIGLPDFDGMEATKKIRALSDSKKANVPIVAVTGHGRNPVWQEKCKAAGMNDVLNKPASPTMLQATLERYVPQPIPYQAATEAAPVARSAVRAEHCVLDWATTLASAIYQGDVALAKKFLSMLVDDLEEKTKPVLTTAYPKKDTTALWTELHRAQGGVVAVCRAPQLAQALEAFHEAIEADPQDPTQMDLTYTEAIKAIDRFCTVIRQGNFDGPIE